jgi:hypothetical protein
MGFCCLYCEQHTIGKFGHFVIIYSGAQTFLAFSYVCLHQQYSQQSKLNSLICNPVKLFLDKNAQSGQCMNDCLDKS